DLALVAPRAEHVADAAERGLVVTPVGGAVLGRHALVGVGVHHRQMAVAGDEEARDRENDAEHHQRTKAPTCFSRASWIRMRCIGTKSAGRRSGSNQPSSSDSSPQASVPPTIRHSNDVLT